MKKNKPSYFFISSLFLLFLFTKNLSAKEYSSQLHAGIGVVSGNFSGPTTGSFVVPMSLNFEYELIQDSNSSYIFDTTVAIDSKDSKTKYFATHLGKRYYLWSSNLSSFQKTEKGEFSISPKLRFFAGWQLGVAHVVVASLGPILDVSSTVLEYGGHTGTIYQVNRSWGIEGRFNLNLGRGLSTISVNSFIMQVFVGGAYYY